MGAIKRLLPSNWNAIKDVEIESIHVTSAGFARTITVQDGTSMKVSFGHTYMIKEGKSIKEVVVRLVTLGFDVEVNTKQKKEELT